MLTFDQALGKAGFDPNEPRNEQGEWTATGEGGGLTRRKLLRGIGATLLGLGIAHLPIAVMAARNLARGRPWYEGILVPESDMEAPEIKGLKDKGYRFERNSDGTYSVKPPFGKAGFDPNESRKPLSFEQALLKGYPEFRIDQERDPKTGRWSGGSGTTPHPLSFKDQPAMQAFIERRLPNSRVVISPQGKHATVVKVDNPSGELHFMLDHIRGKPVLKFISVFSSSGDQGYRFARDALAVLVDSATATGAKSIDLTAVQTGSYIWPKLGFDLKVEPSSFTRRTKAGAVAYFLGEVGGLSPSLVDHISAAREYAPVEAVDALNSTLSNRNVTLPTRLANLDYELRPDVYELINGFPPRGRPTLGKAIMMYTGGTYTLPRSRFGNLRAYALQKALLKGYPEFIIDQPRDPRTGRWSGGSGTNLRPGHEARDLLQRNLNARRTPTRSEFEASLTPEQQQFLKDRREQLSSETPTDRLFRHSGAWDPERAALHERLIQQRLDDAMERAKPAPGEAPRLVVMGGRPGSGKTTSLMESGFVPDMNNYLYINADDLRGDNKKFKAGDERYGLPGYEGWNSSLFHTEASDLMDELEKRARDLGLNIIHDATMRSVSASEKLIHDFEDAGYDISGLFVHASPENAAFRAITRGMKPGGRFVPTYVLGTHVNEAAFDAVKYRMSNWKLYDANSRTARLVASGNKDRVTYVKAGFDPNEPRDQEGRWTSGGLDMHDLERAKQEAKKGWPMSSIHLQEEGRNSTLTIFSKNVDFAVTYHPKENIVTVPFIEARQGSGSRDAISAMIFLKKVAQDTGAKAINLLAADESGGFMWPRLGFDLADIWSVRRLTDQVATRLNKGEDEGWFTSDQLSEARSILSAGGAHMGTKLSHLNSPVPLAAIKALTQGTRGYDKPTFGKALLMGTSAHYSLPRARFGSLGRFGKAGFDPNEPRDEEGRWTGDSPIDMGKDVKKTGKWSSREWEDYPGSNMSFDINSYLRGISDPANPFWRKRFDKITKSLDEFIAAHETTASGLVFRGLASKSGRFDSLKAGDVVVDDGFVSTTTNRDMAVYLVAQIKGSDKVLPTDIMEISIPKGWHVGPVDLYMRGHDESEIILPRGSRLRFDERAADDTGHRVFRFTVVR